MIVFVVFTGGTPEHWWSYFTHKKFRHCFLITPVKLSNGDTVMLTLDARVNYISNTIYHNNMDDVANKDGGVTEIYKVQLAKSNSKRYIIDIRTCVSVVKLALNVTWPFVITPKSLRNKLRKQDNVFRVR